MGLPDTHTPLWQNLNYREILKLGGFGSWEVVGIQYISQICNGPNLISFLEIQAEFELPRTNFFKYLQLQHALQSQSRQVPLRLNDHTLIQGILMEGEKRE